MKINVINNTNFKGLFTDASHKNNGDWRMEYQPYSWERKYDEHFVSNNKFGMAKQKEWAIDDSTLPDNEKQYTNTAGYYNFRQGRGSCKDILGTEFYYCDYINNKERKTITEMPAMNLEDSLIVKHQKLDMFLRKKIEKKEEIENSITNDYNKILSTNKDFEGYVVDYDKWRYLRERSQRDNFTLMSSSHKEVIENIKKIYEIFNNQYIKLMNSITAVELEKQKIKSDINELETARKENNLIDISRRDIYDPNKALWDAMQNIKACAGKIIALPHKILSMKELISKIGNVAESEMASKGVKIVDQMIRSRI